MSAIRIKKGLDINLVGKAKQDVKDMPLAETYALIPDDFKNVTPKIVVKQGEKVKAGSVLFFDKKNPEIVFTSPVSGELQLIERGARRKILRFIVKANKEIQYEQFKTGKPSDFSTVEIIEQLIKSGLWTKIIRRPYGIIPRKYETPKAIYISTFDTAPLAPDYNFTIKNYFDEFQAGVDILAKLTSGKIHININSAIAENIFKNTKNAQINEFTGKHPAGNPSVQIFHISPINKGDVVWTVNPQDVVFIGRLFSKGILDLTKIIALTGSEVKNPQYYKIISSAQISDLLKNNINEGKVRIISGNVLNGTKIPKNGYLGAFDNQITVVPEGDYYEMFGWMKPGLNKFSASKFFLSWLKSNKEWKLDTGLHGGERPFVLTDKLNKVMPMDILPIQLIKACMAEDIDMMEKLGIYEVLEEDFALCEVISETKLDFQKIIRDAINLMIEEVG